MKKLSILALISAFLFSGCGVAINSQLNEMSEIQQNEYLTEKFEGLGTIRLKSIARWGQESHYSTKGIPTSRLKKLAREVLQERLWKENQFTKADVENVIDTTIFVGQNIDVALMAWDCYESENLSVGQGYRHTQYVCGNGSYIYQEGDGVVTSYQKR